jgi:hypothetical protein
MPCKKRREGKIGKEGQRRKICSWGLQEKGKRVSSSISVKRVLVGSPVAIPLGRLVINFLSRFSGHGGAYESNHFLEQRRRIVMTTVPTSTSNKAMKLKRLKECGFCAFCFSFIWVLFCGGSFFFTFLPSPENILSLRI